jgi:peptidoglycan/xylan/chitin deacetylase (PgdA/CDA1 family)
MLFLAGTGSGTAPEKYVAITFDDGPSGRFTRRLLDGLEERDVKATFFLFGYRLKDYKTLAKRIYDEGHEIGLHGYSHENLGKMTEKELRQEMDRTIAFCRRGANIPFCVPREAVLRRF